MVGTVTNNLTTITNAEAADTTNWDDIGGGQGGGQNLDVFIQGLESYSRKVDNAVLGFSYDTTTGQDLSAAGTHAGLWVSVLQPEALGADGVEILLGDAATPKSGNWSGWIAFTAATWEATKKFYRIWVDPTRPRDFGSGTLPANSLRQFGAEFDVGNVSGNGHNCIIDSINYTNSGLTLTGGTIPSPASFSDLVAQDASDVAGIINNDFIDGAVRIGGAATVFRDSNFSLKAGVQPLAASDWIRIDWDASNGSEDILITFGFLEGIHFTFTGTSATQADLGGLILSAAPLAITMTAAWSWGGSLINSPTLTQGGANLDGFTVDSSTSTTAVVRSATGSYVGGEVKNSDRGMDVTALIDGNDEVTIDATQFSGNTVDITLSHAVDVVVNLINGSFATTVENTGAGNASIVNPKALTVTGLIAGESEVRVRDGSVTLPGGNVNPSPTDTFVMTFSPYSSPNKVTLSVTTNGYEYLTKSIILFNENVTENLTLEPDGSWVA